MRWAGPRPAELESRIPLTQISYDECILRMHRYRWIQKAAMLTALGLPGLMLLDVAPVRVVSLWLLGIAAFAAAHVYRTHYRTQAAAIYDASGEE